MTRDRSASAAARALVGTNIVAGVDPGTRRAGFCALKVDGQDLELLALESFRIYGASIEERLFSLDTRLTAFLNGFRPGLVAVENGYVGRNPQTSLTVGAARGTAVTAAFRAGAIARFVQPAEARKAVGANSNAQRHEAKQRVRIAVAQILRPRSAPDEDAADAGALAIWAANRLWQYQEADKGEQHREVLQA